MNTHKHKHVHTKAQSHFLFPAVLFAGVFPPSFLKIISCLCLCLFCFHKWYFAASKKLSLVHILPHDKTRQKPWWHISFVSDNCSFYGRFSSHLLPPVVDLFFMCSYRMCCDDEQTLVLIRLQTQRVILLVKSQFGLMKANQSIMSALALCAKKQQHYTMYNSIICLALMIIMRKWSYCSEL